VWRWTGSPWARRCRTLRCGAGQHALEGAKELWKVHTSGKCKMFLWLLMHERVWTSERLQRHGMENHGPCTLCSQCAKAIDHLFLGCPFSRELWFRCLRRSGWQRLTPSVMDHFTSWWLRSRKRVAKPWHKAFDLLVALIIWSIWLEHNSRVFRNQVVSVMVVVASVFDWCELWCRANLVVRSLLVV
jgi:hypothetical protein